MVWPLDIQTLCKLYRHMASPNDAICYIKRSHRNRKQSANISPYKLACYALAKVRGAVTHRCAKCWMRWTTVVGNAVPISRSALVPPRSQGCCRASAADGLFSGFLFRSSWMKSFASSEMLLQHAREKLGFCVRIDFLQCKPVIMYFAEISDRSPLKLFALRTREARLLRQDWLPAVQASHYVFCRNIG